MSKNKSKTVTRAQIKKYIERRYTPFVADKVLRALKFPPVDLTYYKFCDYLNKFMDNAENMRNLAF
jgi:hypothetical protein